MTSRKILYVCMVHLFYSSHLLPQVLGPELNSGELVAGYLRKWFHRTVHSSDPTDWDWGGKAIFVKYGITSWLTLSLEGLLDTGGLGKTKRFPDRDYRDFYIGAGATFHIMTVQRFRILLSLHYNEKFGFDRSKSRYHKNIRSTVAAIQVEQTVPLFGQKAVLWVGPAYVFDEIIQYPFGSYRSIIDRSFNNIGLLAGGNLVLFKHVEIFVHFVYADFLQPRLGAESLNWGRTSLTY